MASRQASAQVSGKDRDYDSQVMNTTRAFVIETILWDWQDGHHGPKVYLRWPIQSKIHHPGVQFNTSSH